MKNNKYLIYRIYALVVGLFTYVLIFKTKKFQENILFDSDTNNIKKLPDALIIGVAKCGINKK